MTQEIIKEVVEKFAAEAKKIYGSSLKTVILYGSCARGDFGQDSDIDLMVLLDVPQEKMGGKAGKDFGYLRSVRYGLWGCIDTRISKL